MLNNFLKLFLLVSLFVFPHKVPAYSLSFGLKGGLANSNQSVYGGGFTARVFFNSGHHLFGLGGNKAFYSKSNLVNLHELVEVFYRYKSLTVGAFYGGHVSDVKNYLQDGLFSTSGVDFQNGGLLGLSYFLNSRWEIEIEGLYHNWTSSGKNNYISSWVNLRFWWP